MANLQDPRKSDSPGDVNSTLQDRIIRHLLYLTRLQTQEANRIADRLDRELLGDLENRIAAAVNRLKQMGGQTSLITRQQAAALQDLAEQLSQETSSFMSSMADDFVQRIVRLASQEVEFETKLFSSTIPIEWEFGKPTEQQLRQILENQPIPLNKGGKAFTIREWFDNLSDSTVERANGQIRQGLREGEGMGAIMRRVRDNALGKTKQHAEALARTGVIHSSNQATGEFYRQNDDLIKGIKIIITLDSSTCLTCISYDEGNPYDLDSHPSPPFHVHCRCAKTAVLRSWRELGIDADEMPESTRASMNGQVPESLTYNQWLRRQVNQGNEDIAQEALGARRYQAWVRGNAEISDFVNDSGQMLTLEQIREREGDIFNMN